MKLTYYNRAAWQMLQLVLKASRRICCSIMQFLRVNFWQDACFEVISSRSNLKDEI